MSVVNSSNLMLHCKRLEKLIFDSPILGWFIEDCRQSNFELHWRLYTVQFRAGSLVIADCPILAGSFTIGESGFWAGSLKIVDNPIWAGSLHLTVQSWIGSLKIVDSPIWAGSLHLTVQFGLVHCI
jgi:hypothetical protein